MTTLHRSLLSFLGAATVAACGGGGGAGPGPTNSLTKGGGGGQSDTVLATLSTQLAVSVRDQNNAAVQGVSVNWTAPAGGKVNGSPTATTTTDANGATAVTLTLGPTAGTQTATATAAGVTGSPASFSETATPGNLFALTLNSQSAISGTPNASLNYSVKASDKYGNGRAGASILWAATAGGGTVVPDSNVSGTNGVAATVHQLGASVGFDTVTATSKIPLQGSPVIFGATIVLAPATADVTVGPGVVFAPTSVTIRAGGTVTFTWAAGSGLHGVNWSGAPVGSLPANSTNQTSGTFQVTLNTTGTYTYNCTVHGASMSGSIEVQ
mgnify:CR=1 FL=1